MLKENRFYHDQDHSQMRIQATWTRLRKIGEKRLSVSENTLNVKEKAPREFNEAF